MRRPADSRLFTNLVTHEKDYTKALKTLVSPSHALSAYAAVCTPPLSNTLLHVSAALGEADEALARYADAVEECREHPLRIKQRTEKNLRDVETDMRAVGSGRVASEVGDVKRKLRKARAPGTEVAGAGLFAGTEIERRHLAAIEGTQRLSSVRALRQNNRHRRGSLHKSILSASSAARTDVNTQADAPVLMLARLRHWYRSMHLRPS